MKNRSLVIALALLTASLSVTSVPSISAANPNLLYINPPTQGPFAAGTSFTYQVKVANFDPFNAWDIKVQASTGSLNPTSLSITPNLLTGNFTIPLIELTNCVNGAGSGCTPADGPGIVHSAVFPLGSPPAVASVSGVLFTITYSAVSNTPSTVTIVNDVIAAAGLNVVHTSVGGSYGSILQSDFTISVSPTSLSAAAPPGGSPSATVTVSPVGIFTGSVDLTTSVSPIGTGVTTSTGAASVSLAFGSATTPLSVVVQSNATAGAYTILVTGSATIGTALVSHSAQVALTVSTTLPVFSVTLNPNPLPAVLASYNGTTTVTITSINGFAGTVSLLALPNDKGSNGKPILNAPAAILTSNSVTLAANQSATVSMLVRTFALTPVPAPTPSGLYTINVIGTSGSLVFAALAVVRVTPAVFFLTLHWTHHLVYSKTLGIQTFTATVQNNATSFVLGQVVVKIKCGGIGLTARSDSAGTSLPGGNVAQDIPGPIVSISFDVNVTALAIGSDCVLRAALFYGGSVSSTLTPVLIRKTTYKTNIVNPLIAVNGKIKLSPSRSINFQFDTTLVGKFTVNP